MKTKGILREKAELWLALGVLAAGFCFSVVVTVMEVFK